MTMEETESMNKLRLLRLLSDDADRILLRDEPMSPAVRELVERLVEAGR